MDAAYTPGDGLVVGAGSRWVLLGTDPGPAAADRLWELLTGARGGADAVLQAAQEACGPGAALVLVDLTPGTETSAALGGARHTTRDGVHTLDLGRPADGPARRLVGGVVGAAQLVLRPSVAAALPRSPRTPPRVPAPAAPAPPGLIDAVPPEILAASGPPAPDLTRPPTGRAPAPPGSTGDPLPGVRPAGPRSTGSTVVRRDLAQPVVPPAGRDAPAADDGPPDGSPHLSAPTVAPHLQAGTGDTVLAVHCPTGHVTAAYHPHCRVCGAPVPPQEPRRVPRPRLGTLHLPDGERVPLDRGVVIGRQPAPVPGGTQWPHLVRLPPEATYVSRSHLSIELDGWLVMATDLGSRGGTTLRVAGRPPQRIRGHEPYVWEAGEVLDLADSFEVVYEVTA